MYFNTSIVRTLWMCFLPCYARSPYHCPSRTDIHTSFVTILP